MSGDEWEVPGHRDGSLTDDGQVKPLVELSTWKTPRSAQFEEQRRGWRYEAPEGVVIGAVALSKNSWLRLRIVETKNPKYPGDRWAFVVEKVFWPKNGPSSVGMTDRQKYLRGIPLSRHGYGALQFQSTCAQGLAKLLVAAITERPEMGYQPGHAQGMVMRRPNPGVQQSRELERLQNAAVELQKRVEREQHGTGSGDPEP